MITTEIKQQILASVYDDAKNYDSAARQATAYGISQSQFSRLKKGETENLLSDENWMNIARRLNVKIGETKEVITAATDTFRYIYGQLEFAQQNSVSGLLCDRADIGKTHTAKIYVLKNRNAVYIHCGYYKSKQRFIRKIAQEFGVNHTGRYYEVFDALISRLKSVEKPIIILDEYGDLNYETYLEHKALWNETDGFVGWYAMGADGLKRKIERQVDHQKVGFAELFSRMGSKFRRVTPEVDQEFQEFQKRQVSQIGKANGITQLQKLYAETSGSLRRIPIVIPKLMAV